MQRIYVESLNSIWILHFCYFDYMHEEAQSHVQLLEKLCLELFLGVFQHWKSLVQGTCWNYLEYNPQYCNCILGVPKFHPRYQKFHFRYKDNSFFFQKCTQNSQSIKPSYFLSKSNLDIVTSWFSQSQVKVSWAFLRSVIISQDEWFQVYKHPFECIIMSRLVSVFLQPRCILTQTALGSNSW